MYDLNAFCNIIASLRKAKGWTQSCLAEKLGVSPQSVSKWECGIGYPDVTMFPVIAETLSVPIGVLFGDLYDGIPEGMNNTDGKISRQVPVCKNILVYLGNICRIEVIEGKHTTAKVVAEGDPVFLRYFDVEAERDTLSVNIKNPCGSLTTWESYDRDGYTKENLVKIYTGLPKESGANFCSLNFLDLEAVSRENKKGNHEVVCKRISK